MSRYDHAGNEVTATEVLDAEELAEYRHAHPVRVHPMTPGFWAGAADALAVTDRDVFAELGTLPPGGDDE